MYNGILLWSSMDTPSNHSPFTFSEAEPIRMAEQMNRHLTLQLILTQSKGMTVNEIKATNKQEVNAPMSFNDMTMQLNMFTVANDIFLGELNVGSQCLCAVQTMVDANRTTFKARAIADDEFFSKFLFAVDSRFQIWLRQNCTAQNRKEVNDNTIDFNPIVSQVLFGCFQINLPPTFKMKEPATTPGATPSSDPKGGKGYEEKGGRKKPKKGDEDRTMIKNEAPHPELCMLPTETWVINFANKEIDKRPKFNDKWFLNKYCFSNCKNKESHVKANDIPANVVISMKIWIKLCRGSRN
jgi:hypothetical protein